MREFLFCATAFAAVAAILGEIYCILLHLCLHNCLQNTAYLSKFGFDTMNRQFSAMTARLGLRDLHFD